MPAFTQEELDSLGHMEGPLVVGVASQAEIAGATLRETVVPEEATTQTKDMLVDEGGDSVMDDEHSNAEASESSQHDSKSTTADSPGTPAVEEPRTTSQEDTTDDVSMQDVLEAVEERDANEDEVQAASDDESDAAEATEDSTSESDEEDVSEHEEAQSAESTDSDEEEEDEEAEELEEDVEEEAEDEAEDEADAVCSLCDAVVETNSEDSDAQALTCSKCGANVHKRCASDSGTWTDGKGTDDWQCGNCADGQNSRSPEDSSTRRKNAAPRLVRDLLPVSRGMQKPNSHSIFAHPLISEGEEGGRSLRKRKSPTTDPPPSEKRVRKATPKARSIAHAEEESVAHATRRASQKSVPTARVLQHRPPHKPPPHKFILAFHLDQSKIEKVLSKPSRPGRRRDRRRPPKIPPPPIFQAPVPKFPALPTSHLIFPSMWGDRDSELNSKPYGGILSEQEADTSRSLPQFRDREIFETARKEAEEERRKTSAAAEAEINGENTNATKPSRTVSGPPSKIKCIQFGKYVIDTFYAAPYPEEYSHESRLFICEFCLKYLPSEFVAYRHKLKCPAKHPPGDEIYRDGTISIWEVDGRKKTEYCQCLCLMAKMFLGSKTLYYDVEPFLFYILTEYDELGYHFVGYFSKEKRPASQNNVSCILVMPIHQRKGYATFLIDFSYLLTRIECKDGSPEKPLSDMGLTAYRSYWDLTISKQLLDIGMNPFSTKDLMQRTGMTADDVIHSLERLYAFVRDPVTKVYAIRYDKQLYLNIVHEYESKKHRDLKPENLVWTPYIMGRSDQALLDGQPLQTVAPREGDETVIGDSEDQTIGVNGHLDAEEAVSPRTMRAGSRQLSIRQPLTDPRLMDEVGHVAPGPPPTSGLTSTTPGEASVSEHQPNGATNNHSDDGDGLTGYALAFRTHNIPPSRFQIDPPIPTSMLRARLNKRKTPGKSRTNGESFDSPAPAALRSSPRHAASANGSFSEAVSPEKPSTPMRRSNRTSGLANVEVAGLDGSTDENDPDDDIEVKPSLEDDDQAVASTDEDDDEEEDEEGDEEEEEEGDESAAVSEEDEDEDDDDDEDAEVPEEEEDEDSEDDDPEVEIEEDEDDDEEDDD